MALVYPSPLDTAYTLLSSTNWATAIAELGLGTPYPTVERITDQRHGREGHRNVTPQAVGHDLILLKAADGDGKLRSQTLQFEDYQHPITIEIRTDVDQTRLEQLCNVVAQIVKDNSRGSSAPSGYDNINWTRTPRNVSKGNQWKYVWTIVLSAHYRPS